MRRRLLPLHVLPAFEAAARHASFRLAAAELHLTPSAISHQIRTLEDALGMRLFQRLPRGLKLTEAGLKYAETVREALDRLDAERVQSKDGYRRLRVSMPDWVARFVLLPQLARVRSHLPQLDLEIDTSMKVADLESGEADAAIRLGGGRWGSLRSYRLAEFTATIVASAELASKACELSRNGELPMICLKQLEQCTRDTLRSLGLAARAERALRFDNYLDVVQAAEEGFGVALTFHTPNAHLPTTPRLVALSSPLPVPFAMYFVCRELEAELPHIAALRASLLETLSAA